MNSVENLQNGNEDQSEDLKMKAEIWEKKRGRINEKRKPLSKWHASRLRKLQEDDDYASFEKYIKWMGGNVPEDNDDENEYLGELIKEFDSLGGYEFFKKYDLDLPPCGISIENTYFD